MTSRLRGNLDVSNCLQWVELPGRFWDLSDTPFSLLSSLLFQDIPHRRGKTGKTTFSGKSINRPIHQLDSLHIINNHGSLSYSVPQDSISTSQSDNQSTQTSIDYVLLFIMMHKDYYLFFTVLCHFYSHMFIHLFVSLSAYPPLIQVCVWFLKHYKSRARKGYLCMCVLLKTGMARMHFCLSPSYCWDRFRYVWPENGWMDGCWMDGWMARSYIMAGGC